MEQMLSPKSSTVERRLLSPHPAAKTMVNVPEIIKMQRKQSNSFEWQFSIHFTYCTLHHDQFGWGLIHYYQILLDCLVHSIGNCHPCNLVYKYSLFHRQYILLCHANYSLLLAHCILKFKICVWKENQL